MRAHTWQMQQTCTLSHGTLILLQVIGHGIARTLSQPPWEAAADTAAEAAVGALEGVAVASGAEAPPAAAVPAETVTNAARPGTGPGTAQTQPLAVAALAAVVDAAVAGSAAVAAGMVGVAAATEVAAVAMEAAVEATVSMRCSALLRKADGVTVSIACMCKPCGRASSCVRGAALRRPDCHRCVLICRWWWIWRRRWWRL